MSNLVSLTEFKKKKEPEEDNNEAMYYASEVMLETAEELFDEAIILGRMKDKVQLSSTYEDVTDIVDVLEEALQLLYKEMDEVIK